MNGAPFSPEEVTRIRDLCLAGKSQRQIARTLSSEFRPRRHGPVGHVIRQNGFQVRRSLQEPAIRKRLMELWDAGVTTKVAATIVRQEFGIERDPKSIRTAWTRMGINIKRPRRPPERWRGCLPIPEHVHPLVREFFQRLNAELTTMGEVAERAGMSRKGISDWRTNKSPQLVTFEAALNVLDLELCIRPRKVPA